MEEGSDFGKDGGGAPEPRALLLMACGSLAVLLMLTLYIKPVKELLRVVWRVNSRQGEFGHRWLLERVDSFRRLAAETVAVLAIVGDISQASAGCPLFFWPTSLWRVTISACVFYMVYFRPRRVAGDSWVPRLLVLGMLASNVVDLVFDPLLLQDRPLVTFDGCIWRLLLGACCSYRESVGMLTLFALTRCAVYSTLDPDDSVVVVRSLLFSLECSQTVSLNDLMSDLASWDQKDDFIGLNKSLARSQLLNIIDKLRPQKYALTSFACREFLFLAFLPPILFICNALVALRLQLHDFQVRHRVTATAMPELFELALDATLHVSKEWEIGSAGWSSIAKMLKVPDVPPDFGTSFLTLLAHDDDRRKMIEVLCAEHQMHPSVGGAPLQVTLVDSLRVHVPCLTFHAQIPRQDGGLEYVLGLRALHRTSINAQDDQQDHQGQDQHLFAEDVSFHISPQREILDRVPAISMGSRGTGSMSSVSAHSSRSRESDANVTVVRNANGLVIFSTNSAFDATIGAVLPNALLQDLFPADEWHLFNKFLDEVIDLTLIHNREANALYPGQVRVRAGSQDGLAHVKKARIRIAPPDAGDLMLHIAFRDRSKCKGHARSQNGRQTQTENGSLSRGALHRDERELAGTEGGLGTDKASRDPVSAGFGSAKDIGEQECDVPRQDLGPLTIGRTFDM